MGAQENKDFIRKYLEAVSGKPKPPELVDQFVAEQPLKDHIAGGELGFPRYTMDIDMMVAEDDLVSVIGRFGGTHIGPFMGIPATGKTFSDVRFTSHTGLKAEKSLTIGYYWIALTLCRSLAWPRARKAWTERTRGAKPRQ